jgi:hypothetical protein
VRARPRRRAAAALLPRRRCPQWRAAPEAAAGDRTQRRRRAATRARAPSRAPLATLRRRRTPRADHRRGMGPASAASAQLQPVRRRVPAQAAAPAAPRTAKRLAKPPASPPRRGAHPTNVCTRTQRLATPFPGQDGAEGHGALTAPALWRRTRLVARMRGPQSRKRVGCAAGAQSRKSPGWDAVTHNCALVYWSVGPLERLLNESLTSVCQSCGPSWQTSLAPPTAGNG